jgi:predicted lipoprotein with Yx(FWY)xxD motif
MIMLSTDSAPHLVDGTGKALYLWVADTAGKSTCSGACAIAWPPVTATGTPTAGAGVTASQLSTVKRDDGSSQVTYAGHPLYYFVQDKAAGDAKGQGSDSFGAKWWLVDGAGTAITTASSGAPSTSTSSTSGGGTVSGY